MIFGLNSIFIIFSWLIGMNHPVHVSITNVDYNQTENKAEISIKVFKDDFQLLFVHLYQINLEIDKIEEDPIVMEKVNTYFSNHLKVKLNEKEQQILKYKGLKKNDDSVWFYYEIEINKEPKSLEFENTILLDLYFDQKNMLIFGSNEKEKGFLFNLKDRNNTIWLHDFKKNI